MPPWLPLFPRDPLDPREVPFFFFYFTAAPDGANH
jgi:hypothetical protein